MKYRSIMVVVALFILVAHVFGEDRRPNKQTLSIMTLNAEFLFDGVEPEGSANFDWKGSPDEAQEHLEEIAQVIGYHSPDIVNIVEVENIDVLESLISEYLANQGYTAYLIPGKDYTTRQNVGLLTRIDPVGGNVHRSETKGESNGKSKGVSKHYFASFDLSGVEFMLVGLHFRAFPSNASVGVLRQAQADAITKIINANIGTGHDLVVLGYKR